MAKSVKKKLQKHLKNCLSDYFDKDAFFILGVSGGPDSMALLYLFHELNLDGLVVHVNYARRGKESDTDQELVEQIAFSWGFECCSIRLNPEDAKGENFQEWARNQRYQFFRDLKGDFKADAIVTAHHRDDQVETILQKIFRGSAPTAWQGMRVWDGELFRPLLSFSKQDLLTFCEAEAIPFRIDESNKSSEYARNFLRNEFTPKMNTLFPGWKKNVLNLTEQAQTFEASMNILADQVSSSNFIHREKFNELPAILKPAVLKTILDQVGLEGEYSKGQLKELAEVDSLQTGKKLRIGNVLLIRDRNEIRIEPDKEGRDSDKIAILNKHSIDKEVEKFGIKFKLKSRLSKKAGLQLDSDKLAWPLALRTWGAGDAFHPLGMDGHQKISDHLTNRKIPSHLKEKALVLCGSDSTIYAIIYPVSAVNGERGAVSEMAKYNSTSQTFLTINFT